MDVNIDLDDQRRTSLAARAAELGVSPADLEAADRVESTLLDTAVVSQISYAELEEAYMAATGVLGEEPCYIRVSPRRYASIKRMFDANQRFSVTSANGQTIGVIQLKYNNASITADRDASDNRLSFSLNPLMV